MLLGEVSPGPHIDTEEASEMKAESAFICLRLSPSPRLRDPLDQGSAILFPVKGQGVNM